MTPISLYFECKRSRFRLTQDTYSTTRDFNFPINLIGIHCLGFHELLIIYIYIYLQYLLHYLYERHELDRLVESVGVVFLLSLALGGSSVFGAFG